MVEAARVWKAQPASHAARVEAPAGGRQGQGPLPRPPGLSGREPGRLSPHTMAARQSMHRAALRHRRAAAGVRRARPASNTAGVEAPAGGRPGGPPTTTPGLEGPEGWAGVHRTPQQRAHSQAPGQPASPPPAAHHKAPQACRAQPPTSLAASPPFCAVPPASVALPRQPPAAAASRQGQGRQRQPGNASRGLGGRAVHQEGGGGSIKVDKGMAQGRARPPRGGHAAKGNKVGQ